MNGYTAGMWLWTSVLLHLPPPPGGCGPSGRSLSFANLYERINPAVVGVRARAEKGEYYGTATIIDPEGHILTSTTVLPPGSTEIRITLPGGRVFEAKLLATDPEKEFALARLPSAGAPFPYLRLGDSDALRVGQVVFTLGNAFRGIEQEAEVSMASGVLSGIYDLAETRSEAQYKGRVIETTAAVNPGGDGGPLVDPAGRMIGVVCLNYSPSRWLGTAIPANVLKPLLRAAIKGPAPEKLANGTGGPEAEPGPAGWAGYIGAAIGRDDAGIVVARVARGGPADRAGLRPGDRVLAVDGDEVRDLADFSRRLKGHPPGEVVRLRVGRGGATLAIDLRIGRIL